jgi:hypothetical protein
MGDVHCRDALARAERNFKAEPDPHQKGNRQAQREPVPPRPGPHAQRVRRDHGGNQQDEKTRSGRNAFCHRPLPSFSYLDVRALNRSLGSHTSQIARRGKGQRRVRQPVDSAPTPILIVLPPGTDTRRTATARTVVSAHGPRKSVRPQPRTKAIQGIPRL